MKTKILTLLFLRRDNQILLAMKKRGYGVGRWNGVGGKLEADETIEQGLIRECQEEINVTPTKYHKVAEHRYTAYHEDEKKLMIVHTFVATEWQGEPAETEEMRPQWFDVGDLPYENMWADDIYWLPQVLEGKQLQTNFEFDADDKIISHEVIEVDNL